MSIFFPFIYNSEKPVEFEPEYLYIEIESPIILESPIVQEEAIKKEESVIIIDIL